MISISVLLAVHNGARWLAEAIESVRSQTCKEWELVVVINGSTDDSEAIATAAASGDDRIVVIVLDEKGKNNAYNKAYERACGHYVCFFAADDLLSSDSLERRHTAIADKTPDVFSTCLLQLMSNDPRYDGIQMPRQKKRANLSGGCVMFSRQLAEKVFPLPTKYPNEDTWVQLHLRLFGVGVHVPEVLYFYRIHDRNSFGYHASFNEKRSQFMLRMQCYTDVYERYRYQYSDSEFLDKVLGPYVVALKLCEQRRLMRILFFWGITLSQRLVLAGYCHAGLFTVRVWLGRFITGRFGQG